MESDILDYGSALVTIVTMIKQNHIDGDLEMSKTDIINIAMSNKTFYVELKGICDSILEFNDKQCYFMFNENHPHLPGRRCHNNMIIKKGLVVHRGGSLNYKIINPIGVDINHECIEQCENQNHYEYDIVLMDEICERSKDFGEYLYKITSNETTNDNIYLVLCHDHLKQMNSIENGIGCIIKDGKNPNRCKKILSSTTHKYIDQITHKKIKVKGIPNFIRCDNYCKGDYCYLHEDRSGLCTQYMENRARYCRNKIKDEESKKCGKHMPKDKLSLGLMKKCAKDECYNQTRNIYCLSCINQTPRCIKKGCNKPQKMGKYCLAHYM